MLVIEENCLQQTAVEQQVYRTLFELPAVKQSVSCLFSVMCATECRILV